MDKLPKAKSENIVVNALKDEVLVYDLTTNRAFCLNDTSAKVFNACDGTQTFEELKRKYQFTDEIIYLALDGLRKENLITEDYASPFAGISRRKAISKVGLASMIALPVISGLVAPGAAAAASPVTCTAANATRTIIDGSACQFCAQNCTNAGYSNNTCTITGNTSTCRCC